MSSVLEELSSPTTSRRRLGVLRSSRSSDWTDRRRVQPLGSSSCSYAAANWLTTRRSTWGIRDEVSGAAEFRILYLKQYSAVLELCWSVPKTTWCWYILTTEKQPLLSADRRLFPDQICVIDISVSHIYWLKEYFATDTWTLTMSDFYMDLSAYFHGWVKQTLHSDLGEQCLRPTKSDTCYSVF